MLVYRSGFLPCFLGAWLVVNGAAYVALSGIGLMRPELSGKAFLYAQPCSSANLPSCCGSSSRARSKSRWRRRPDATFRLATGQLFQSFRVPSPFHLISLTLSKLALWSANLPLSDEVRIARHPTRVDAKCQIGSCKPTSHYQSGSMSDSAISHSSRLS
jgi:hypothetical protein